MSGHGWVTPNPDGTKARCGGPAICPECAREQGTQKPAAIGERIAKAALALGLRGLALLLVRPEGYIVTDKPDKPETGLRFETIEQVEQFIADPRRTGPQEDTAPLRQPKPGICDIVHYVSFGTPGGEYGKECRAAMVTEATQVEVNEQNPSGDGIFRQTVGLMVANPTGLFFSRGVLYAAGTFRGPARDAGPGEALPIITCADLEFPGGTWHWAGAQ